MRIEIIRSLHPLERERYEFVVNIVSRGIYIHLTSYRAERRDSLRHRIYKPFKAWFYSENDSRAYLYIVDRVNKPSVPLEVEADMRKHFERAIHHEFTTIPT